MLYTGLLKEEIEDKLNKEGVFDFEIERLDKKDLEVINNIEDMDCINVSRAFHKMKSKEVDGIHDVYEYDVPMKKITKKKINLNGWDYLSITAIMYAINREEKKVGMTCIYTWYNMPVRRGYDIMSVYSDRNLVVNNYRAYAVYDYVNTGGNKGFMNNNEYFYLTNIDKDKNLMYIDSTGKTNSTDDSDILGVKAIITLKNTLTLKEGNGTKDNPYTFEDKEGLLGSYVKLGNDTWRIYSIEDNTVKLSLDNYLKVNNKEVKYKYSNNGYYHNDTKQGTLAEYLNKTYLNTLSYKDKIKENKFANGIYSSTTNYDYSKVLTTTVDTKISVLSIGNIILNNNNTNYFLSTGVSKNSNLVYVMQDDYKVYTKVSTTTLKIVPTIALDKSLLTKGDGTIESPYEVE